MKKIILALSMLATSQFSSAALVNVTFTGNLTGMFYAKCTHLQNGSCSAWKNTSLTTSSHVQSKSVSVGDQFKVSSTYDTTTPITAVIDNQAVYLEGVLKGHLSVGDFDQSYGSGSYSVVNNRNGSFDSFYIAQSIFIDGWHSQVGTFLNDNTGATFADYSAPLSLDFSKFGYSSLQMAFVNLANGDQLQVNGSIKAVSTSVAPVPEPETYALMGMGLLGLLAARRRKATNQ